MNTPERKPGGTPTPMSGSDAVSNAACDKARQAAEEQAATFIERLVHHVENVVLREKCHAKALAETRTVLASLRLSADAGSSDYRAWTGVFGRREGLKAVTRARLRFIRNAFAHAPTDEQDAMRRAMMSCVSAATRDLERAADREQCLDPAAWQLASLLSAPTSRYAFDLLLGFATTFMLAQEQAIARGLGAHAGTVPSSEWPVHPAIELSDGSTGRKRRGRTTSRSRAADRA